MDHTHHTHHTHPSYYFEAFEFKTRPGDAFQTMRSPQNEFEHAKEKLYWNWVLHAHGSGMSKGNRMFEQFALLNTDLGRLDLRVRGVNLTDTSALPFPEFYTINEGMNATKQLWDRAHRTILMNDLFKTGKLKYVTQSALDQLDPDDKICGISLEEFQETESKDWLDPIEAPKFCFPEFLQQRYDFLGEDDRIKFTDRLTEIWNDINAIPDDVWESEQHEVGPLQALEVCCQELGMAIKKYKALTPVGKAEAQISQESPTSAQLVETLLENVTETVHKYLLSILNLSSWLLVYCLGLALTIMYRVWPHSVQVDPQVQQEPQSSSAMTLIYCLGLALAITYLIWPPSEPVEPQVQEEPQPSSATPPDEVIPPEQGVDTSCGHHFGMIMLSNWLSKSRTCPTCRRELNPPQDQPELLKIYDASFRREVYKLFGHRVPSADIEEFLRTLFLTGRERSG